MMYCCSTGISGKTAVRTTRMNTHTHTHTHSLRNWSRKKKKKARRGKEGKRNGIKCHKKKKQDLTQSLRR